VITQSTTNASREIVFEESNMHLLHGEFGPKLELRHSWRRPFFLAKVGFDKFLLDACPETFNCLSSAIHNPLVNTLDVGHEIYFNAGMHNNFRMRSGRFCDSSGRVVQATGGWPECWSPFEKGN
jgi:hypothetical protein